MRNFADTPGGARPYFRGFFGLRAIAALAVLFHHLEQWKAEFGLRNLWDQAWVKNLGPMGVDIFFCLSGFLITYLLLQSRNALGNPDWRSFYERRIRRIFPVYYLVCFLAFLLLPFFLGFLLPGEDPLAGLLNSLRQQPVTVPLLFFFGFPNLALRLFPPVPGAAHLWSIGYEEQFYAAWPWVLRLSPKRAALACVAMILTRRLTLAWLFTFRHTPSPIAYVSYYFLESFPLEFLCVGALAAILHFERPHWEQRWIVSRPGRWFTVPLILALLLWGGSFTHKGAGELGALLVAFCLLNLAGYERSPLNLELPWLRQLGKMSYGIYMYHGVALILLTAALKGLGLWSGDSWFFLLGFSASAFALPIVTAWASYRFVESRFLRAD